MYRHFKESCLKVLSTNYTLNELISRSMWSDKYSAPKKIIDVTQDNLTITRMDIFNNSAELNEIFKRNLELFENCNFNNIKSAAKK